MTLDEFMVWDAPGAERWQLVDGEPVAMPLGPLQHGALLADTATALGNHLHASGSKFRTVIGLGFVPRVRSNMNYRIPSLAVIGAPPSQGHEMREPLLLVEVLSSGNQRQTRANVWAYTTLPSIREILLLRSSRIEGELLRRDANSDWPADAQVIGPGGTLHLDSIGFTAPLSDLYRTIGLAGPV